MKRRETTPRRRWAGSRPRCEWIGGLVSPPFFIEEGEQSYRPGVVLWVEMPSGLVVGQEVLAPGDVDGAVGRVLVAALEQSVPGAQPAPDAIRVADAGLAAEVRAVLGGRVPIEVALTTSSSQYEHRQDGEYAHPFSRVAIRQPYLK